jgi:hypothetical protein
MAQCTAKSKQSGQRCKKDAIPGRVVCHMHGGRSPTGIASPQYKHGRYSRGMPVRLRARYEQATTDPKLLELREEIALLDARAGDLLSRVDTGESGALWRELMQARAMLLAARRAGNAEEQAEALNAILDLINQGHTDYRAWSEVGSVLEARRRMVESERRRLVEMQQMITSEQAMLLIGAIGGIVKAHVPDKIALAAISQDIRSLLSAEEAGQS